MSRSNVQSLELTEVRGSPAHAMPSLAAHDANSQQCPLRQTSAQWRLLCACRSSGGMLCHEASGRDVSLEGGRLV